MVLSALMNSFTRIFVIVADPKVYSARVVSPGGGRKRRFRVEISPDPQFPPSSAPVMALCDEIACCCVILPKTPPKIETISTTEIVQRIAAPREVPLRIDFTGGWRDVPKHSRKGGFIVNCAISPKVSRHDWPYEKKAGLGGSGAWALLEGRDSIEAELNLGVGWQAPAVIREMGICVWKNGQSPQLDFKRDGSFLDGLMALVWTGSQHDTPGSVDLERDYDLIEAAGAKAR